MQLSDVVNYPNEKTLNGAMRIRSFPSVDTEPTLPNNLPSLFPEITCPEAIEIAEEFIRQARLTKKVFICYGIGVTRPGRGTACRTAPAGRRIGCTWPLIFGVSSTLQRDNSL